jgi:hypothetical protein
MACLLWVASRLRQMAARLGVMAPGGSDPGAPAYRPALKFNDRRNSMYL